jgi:chorismate synthase
MNEFGRVFRVTTFGESHGPALGCVIDGVPAGFPVDLAHVQHQLDRRRPGQSQLVTPRGEKDRVRVLSGLLEGRSTGAPITLIVENHDADSRAYEPLRSLYRPSHADYTYDIKYGHRDWRGGGRASARETVARVAAGAVAEQVLHAAWGIEVVAWVSDVHGHPSEVDPSRVDRNAVDQFPTRCPDPTASAQMESAIRDARKRKDSVGGSVRCVARNVPPGLGDPVFGKLEASLGSALLGLPAAKAFEVGSGFDGTRMYGSAHNDPFVSDQGRIRTRTNHSGGIQGGISNGEAILVRVGFKPVATIFQPQDTVTTTGDPTTFAAKGRHDPCVLPRAVPIVEAMVSLVLLDHALLHLGAQALRSRCE